MGYILTVHVIVKLLFVEKVFELLFKSKDTLWILFSHKKENEFLDILFRVFMSMLNIDHFLKKIFSPEGSKTRFQLLF